MKTYIKATTVLYPAKDFDGYTPYGTDYDIVEAESRPNYDMMRGEDDTWVVIRFAEIDREALDACIDEDERVELMTAYAVEQGDTSSKTLRNMWKYVLGRDNQYEKKQ